MRRERDRKRQRLLFNVIPNVPQGLYFDGRKDRTLTQSKKGKKSCRKVKLEEHRPITLVQQHESLYIGHVTPESGSAVRPKHQAQHCHLSRRKSRGYRNNRRCRM